MQARTDHVKQYIFLLAAPVRPDVLDLFSLTMAICLSVRSLKKKFSELIMKETRIFVLLNEKSVAVCITQLID